VEKYGKNKWRKYVVDVVERLTAALEPDEIVVGGGNVEQLKKMPRAAVKATTLMHSQEVSAFGRRPIDRGAPRKYASTCQNRQLLGNVRLD